MRFITILVIIARLVFLCGLAQAAEYFEPVSQQFVTEGEEPQAGEPGVPGMPLSSENLYGSEVMQDSLLLINKGTAGVSFIGPIGTPTPAALAYDMVSGFLYATDTSTLDLVKIDPTNGNTTVVGNTGITLPHGAAIDPSDGTLYVASDHSNLYTVNKATGAATLVGPIGFPHIGALDFDPCTGTLYGAYAWSDATGYLITINKATGQGTFVANTHRINGMSFDLNGQLYASENSLTQGVPSHLYSVDKTTGAWTDIGSLGVDNVLGLVFDSVGASATEPATWGSLKVLYR
jgi:DNA-binding beta-propeller fold protein YncE